MDVQHTPQSATLHQLVVTIEPERVDQVFASVSRSRLKNAQVRGFRPGRAPRAMVERAMAGQIASDAREQLLQGSLAEALGKANLNPIAPPALLSVGQAARGAMFTYTLSCEVLPAITLAQTDGLNVEVKASSVDDAAVQARLAAKRDEAAQIEPVTGRTTIEAGDWVTLSYTTEADGAEVPELAGKDATLDTSDADILPDLVQALIGSSVPGRCDCRLTLPQNFHHKHLAGKQVTMHAELTELKTRVLPPLDDAFAMDLGHSSLAALREATCAELEAAARTDVEQATRASLLSALVAANPVEVPEALVEQELDQNMQATEQRFMQLTGQPMQRDPKERQALRERLRERAVRGIKAALLLLEVAKQQGFSVDDQARQAAIDARVADAGKDAQRVRAYFDDPQHRHSLDSSLLQDMATAHLLARANKQPAAAEVAATAQG